MTGGSQSQTIEPTYQGVPASALRFHEDRGPSSMVDRLKTTESVSQGGGVFAFSHKPDRSCMHQTAKLQYHCFHTSEFDSSVCSSFCYTGNRITRSLGWQTMPKDASPTSYGGPECLLRLEWQIGPNTRTYPPGGQGAGVLHTANQQRINS